jgi:hypothetical protein
MELTAVTYLQVRNAGGPRAKVVRATQTMPEVTDPGCIVIKLQIKVPVEAFRPVLASVDVPLELVQQRPITVEVASP